VIFEWTKGIKLRDGNFVREDGTIDDFSGIDSSIVNFWKEFYAKRKEYHAWCPEICASDYTMIKKVLRKLPFIEDSKEFEWDEKENVNWSDIKKWIENRAYSNFYRGLTIKEQGDLIKWVNDKINTVPKNKNWIEKLGCRVTIFKYLGELNNEKIEEIILSSLNETSIFPKLIWEEEKYENLLQFSVLLVQHDFITENTLFFTMNKWDMIENTWDKLDKPMIFNRSCDKNGEFLKSMLVYYAFIEKFNISATDLIFRDFRYKPILIIRKNNEWSVKKYKNTLGMIEKLEIGILSINSYKINFSVENINEEFHKAIKEDIFHVDFNAQEVKDYIQRIKNSISEDFFNTYKYEIENGKNVLKSTLLDEESPLLPDEEKLESFVKILFLHSLIIPEWDTAVYIPAISLLPEKEETGLIGLGGIILFERNGKREDLNEFLENRINVIKTVINLKFRSLGIAEYARKVKHEIKRHALRSAVAAIMSRNMSHNIGSHVLAYYEQSLKEIDREAQPLDEAREKFNRYLQARMDYIAYVTTITPSYGVGFTLEEVINEFNENKILIKGLAASENFKEVQINLINDNSTYKDLLSFSMGELGKHALFNIFEGIARNTAKHGYPEGPPNGIDKLSIYVKPIDKGEFVQLEIWDDAKSYEKAKIALNLDGDKEKDARYHKFIDDTGALQSEFWGIKEMRVGSLFLKRIPLTKIQDDEILAIDFKNKEGSLCYVLNMYKFKYLLIVSNKVNGFQRGRYIDMVNTEKLNELGKTEYKLCVIDNETTLSPEEEMNLPLRRIYDNIDDKKLVLSNDEENEKKLVLEYYEKWLRKRCELNSTEIIYSPLDDKVIKEIENKWGKNITVKKIDPCTENLKNKIIFAGHLIKISIKCEGKDEQSYVQACLSKDPLFIQDVSGKTQYLKTTLNNPPADDFKKRIFVYEIKEAACESVIIFDERLWKRYKEEEDYPEYLQKGQNIIFANLKSDNRGKKEIEFKDLKEQTVLTIKKQDSNGLSFEWKNSKKYTFACFHLGIIEKISEIFDVGVSIVIENLSRNKKNTFEHLIIHTGRGKTFKYDRPLLYMDLTSLQRGVEEGKIYLIQTLYSLKPTERG
jgi:hypothetical protein